MSMSYEDYRDMWAKKTARQIEREIESMHRHMTKHDGSYQFSGSAMTAPGEMGDGDRVRAMKEALEIRKAVKK